MLTVHHLETSRSQRILWLLEELGVPYELKVYKRDKVTRLAPPELKAIHPLGKSPVVTDDGLVIAESAVIIEYIVEKYGHLGTGELAHLAPAAGTPAYWQSRYWMHYAEGSLMNWLVMKLVFSTIPTRPMPFFAKPIARGLCDEGAGDADRSKPAELARFHRGSPHAQCLVRGRRHQHGGLPDELRDRSPVVALSGGRQVPVHRRVPQADAGAPCVPACGSEGRTDVDGILKRAGNGP